MSKQDVEKLINSFICCRFGYCYAVFIILPKKTIRQLQLGQNAAPATLTITKKSSQIKPVISSHYFKKEVKKTALINPAGHFKTI